MHRRSPRRLFLLHRHILPRTPQLVDLLPEPRELLLIPSQPLPQRPARRGIVRRWHSVAFFRQIRKVKGGRTRVRVFVRVRRWRSGDGMLGCRT